MALNIRSTKKYYIHQVSIICHLNVKVLIIYQLAQGKINLKNKNIIFSAVKNFQQLFLTFIQAYRVKDKFLNHR